MFNRLIGSVRFPGFEELERGARIHRIRFIRFDSDPVEEIRNGLVSGEIRDAGSEAVAERKRPPRLEVHLVRVEVVLVEAEKFRIDWIGKLVTDL